MVVDQSIYGVDIKIENGDLVINSSGDFDYVDGLDCVSQAITNKLYTEKGELLYNDIYGLAMSKFIGLKNTPKQQEYMKLQIQECLRQDPRIETIDYIRLFPRNDNPYVIDINIQCKPILSENRININLVYPFTSLTSNTNDVSETLTSLSNDTIDVQYNISSVKGVWLSNDIDKKSTNYFNGGNFFKNRIKLGTPLIGALTSVTVDYVTRDTIRSSPNINNIISERQGSINKRLLFTTNQIYSISGIWLLEDTNKQLTNYAIGASFEDNQIALSQDLPDENTIVLVDYSALRI